MTSPLAGWLSYGHYSPKADAFEPAEHPRVAFDVPVETIFSFTDWIDIAGPERMVISSAAIFPTDRGGLPLVRWQIRPNEGLAPCSIPPHTIWVDLALPVTHAVNATVGGGEVADLQIERGDQVGRVNGSPLIAMARLGVVGGRLVSRSSLRAKATAA